MDYLNVSRCFSILHRRSQQFIIEACADLVLYYSEYVMLIRLFANEGVSQDELASMLCLDKAVVTRAVKNLEERGFLHRDKDSTDRRVKRLFLTEYGKSRKNYLEGILDVWVNELAAGMPSEEIASIMGTLDTLANRAYQINTADLMAKYTAKNM